MLPTFPWKLGSLRPDWRNLNSSYFSLTYSENSSYVFLGFMQEEFYARGVLCRVGFYQEGFMQEGFYTGRVLCRRGFIQEQFYAGGVLCKRSFMHYTVLSLPYRLGLVWMRSSQNSGNYSVTIYQYNLNAFLSESWKLFGCDLPVQFECVPLRILEIIRFKSARTIWVRSSQNPGKYFLTPSAWTAS